MKRKQLSKLGEAYKRTCHKMARMKASSKYKAAAVRKSKTLKAISVCCPHVAAAILSRQKLIENRTWPMTEDCAVSGGGWLALHVGRSPNPSILDHIYKNWEEQKYADGHKIQRWAVSGKPGTRLGTWYSLPPRELGSSKHKWRDDPNLPAHSAIVGFIRVSGMHEYKRGESKTNPWAIGPICWEIDRVVQLEPPIRNVLGNVLLWSVDDAVKNSAERRRLYRAFRQVRDNNLGRLRWNPNERKRKATR